MILSDLVDKRSFVLASLLFVGAIRFVNLGFGEIQEWDEALYAVRAKSIVYFGDWLDQTDHSVGGLYSASHPPLFIWLTAIGYKLFGISNFTTRLWSALFGSAILLVVYHFGKHLYSALTGYVAAVLLGTTPLFTFYSRQGQLDIAYLFFFVSSLYLFALHLDKGRLSLLLLSGAAFGLSLMSKSLAGLLALPVAFLVFLLWPKSTIETNRRSFIPLIIYALTGFAIAFPWYVFMQLHHPADSAGGFFLAHVVRSVQSVAEGLGSNVKELGYLYFLNQLIVRFPLCVLGFGYLLIVVVRSVKKTGISSFRRIEWLVPLWFLLVFVVFSILHTKVISYAVPMLIPMALLAARSLEKLSRTEFGPRTSSGLLFATSITLLWSFSDPARVAIKDFLKSLISATSSPAPLSPIVSFFILSIIILGVFIAASRSDRLQAILVKYLIPGVVLFSLVTLVFQVAYVQDDEYTDGAKVLADRINVAPYEEILYLYTPHYTGGMNPQLAYYLDGVNSGWAKGKRFVEMSRGKVDSLGTSMAHMAGKRGFIVIEKNYTDSPEESPELRNVEAIVSTRHDKLLETKRYILYGKS